MPDGSRRGTLKGYGGSKPNPSFTYISPPLLGQDDTGPYINTKPNHLNLLERQEKADSQKRRGKGYGAR